MDPQRHSVTALAASLFRAVHTRCDRPTIVEDGYGERFVTAAERAFILERLLLMLHPVRRAEILAVPDPARALDLAVRANPAYATILVRGRYAEDRLAATLGHGVGQYVLLGAGMDTFAFRRRDLAPALQVFELDHPATQAMKRERLALAGLAPPAHLHFVPVDLERESVDAALARSPYQRGARGFFTCLGVMPYLTRAANLRLLRAIAADAAPGSELVFDYLDLDAFTAERAADEARRMAAERAATAEPWVSGFDPQRLAGDLAAEGLELDEDLDAEQAASRYLAGRNDGLRMVPHGHLARARVREAA